MHLDEDLPRSWPRDPPLLDLEGLAEPPDHRGTHLLHLLLPPRRTSRASEPGYGSRSGAAIGSLTYRRRGRSFSLAGKRNILLIDGYSDADRGRFVHALADAYATGAGTRGHSVRKLELATIEVPMLRSGAEWMEEPPRKAIRHPARHFRHQPRLCASRLLRLSRADDRGRSARLHLYELRICCCWHWGRWAVALIAHHQRFAGGAHLSLALLVCTDLGGGALAPHFTGRDAAARRLVPALRQGGGSRPRPRFELNAQGTVEPDIP